jgi:excisionase family DNA binding protein
MATEPTTAGPSANGVAHQPLSPLDVLTLTQAAEYLQLPADLVRAEAEAGRIAGLSVGADWRFLRDAVAAWLRSPRRGPTDNGAELVEHIRRVSTAYPFRETDEEVEAFIASASDSPKPAAPPRRKRG